MVPGRESKALPVSPDAIGPTRERALRTDDILRRFACNGWADARGIAAAEGLREAKLTRDGRSSLSVFATRVHMLGAEWIWLARSTNCCMLSHVVNHATNQRG